jgi:small, acid-soluble spore protein tlp
MAADILSLRGDTAVAKPDNREDNVPRIQRAISNTIRNMREAEDYLDEHAGEIGGEERSRIEAKNERRRESLENLRSEIRDEAKHQRGSGD